MVAGVTSSVIATVIGFVLVSVISFAGGLGWRNYKSIDRLDSRVSQIENKLFGVDADPTDDGFLVEVETKLDRIEEKIDNLNEEK